MNFLKHQSGSCTDNVNVNLSDFIKISSFSVPEMNELLTGFERHESEEFMRVKIWG